MGVPGKKLLVLDVNGFLVDTYYAGESRPDRPHDKKVNRFYVYNRPFCAEFIRFCLENFVVGIWSSAREHNVHAMVDYVFEESKAKLAFIWHQNHCTDTGLRHPDNKHKPLFMKELWRLWKKIESNLPWTEGDFNPSNTVLIDDSPYKAMNNPPHTAIFPKSYNASDVSDNSLAEGLQTYLEGLLHSPDVQTHIQTHPIGEPCIPVGDPQWSHVLSAFKVKVDGDSEVPDFWLGIGVIRSPKSKNSEEEEDTMVAMAAVTAPPRNKDDIVIPLHQDIRENPPRKVFKENNYTFGRNGYPLPGHSYPLSHTGNGLHQEFAESGFVGAAYSRHGTMDQDIASDPAPPGFETSPSTRGHGVGPRMPHPELGDAQRMYARSKSDINYAIPRSFNAPHPSEGFMPLPRARERHWSRHPYGPVSNGNYGTGSIAPNSDWRTGPSEPQRHPGGWSNTLPSGGYMPSQTSRMPSSDWFQQGHMRWDQQDLPEGRSYQNGRGGYAANGGGPHFRRKQAWSDGSLQTGRLLSGTSSEVGVSGHPPPRSSYDHHRWEHVNDLLSRRDDKGYSPRGYSPSRDDGHGGRFI